MASNAKRKTTMAKLNRERKLRERREEKLAKKEARRRASADDALPPEHAWAADGVVESSSDEDPLGTIVQAPADA
jgi:hypothetical protein